MTDDRILSKHGNVIAADFRPRTSFELSLTLSTETLFCDGTVTLIRCTASMGGEAIVITHTLGDLATGQAISL